MKLTFLTALLAFGLILSAQRTRIGVDQLPALNSAGILASVPDGKGNFSLQLVPIPSGCSLTTGTPASISCNLPTVHFGVLATQTAPTTFSLPNVPLTLAACYRNGLQMQQPGEFTIAGGFVTVPLAQTGDTVSCDYVSQ